MAVSTSTLAQIQGDLQDFLSIAVPNQVVILAFNDFSNRVYKIEEDEFPDRERKQTETFQLGSTGLVLADIITDARDFDIGFQVFGTDNNGVIDYNKKYTRTHPADRIHFGYYVLDGTLHMHFPPNGNTTPVKFLYMKKRDIVARGTAPKDVTFPWDADLEEAFRDFMRMKYFDREQLAANVNAANQMAQQAIMSYYSQGQSS